MFGGWSHVRRCVSDPALFFACRRQVACSPQKRGIAWCSLDVHKSFKLPLTSLGNVGAVNREPRACIVHRVDKQALKITVRVESDRAEGASERVTMADYVEMTSRVPRAMTR